MRKYFVYILASYKYGTLYIGVTGNLQNRIDLHQSGKVKGFTQKYNVDKLVYYEEFESPELAIYREIQNGTRYFNSVYLMDSWSSQE